MSLKEEQKLGMGEGISRQRTEGAGHLNEHAPIRKL